MRAAFGILLYVRVRDVHTHWTDSYPMQIRNRATTHIEYE
jgi:hypothetical protein